MTVRVTGLGLAFLSHLILSRMLGANDYGVYVIALGWAMVLVIPARLGLDTSALRYATIYREEGRGEDFRGLIIFSVSAIGLASLVVVCMLLAAKGMDLEQLQQVPVALLAGVAILIPCSAMLGWLSALIRTANRIFASQFYDQMLRPTLLITSIALLAVAGGQINASQAMLATAATVAIAMLGLAIHARAAFAGMAAGPINLQHRREWMSVSWVMLLIAVAQELLNQVDIILLGMFGNATQAAHFSAAWRLSSLVPFGLVAIATVSAPMIASAYNRGDMAELSKIARFNARFALLFALCTVAALAIWGKFLLSLFGPGFAGAFPALVILLVGALINSFTGSAGNLLIMTRHQRAALAILAIALALSIALNLILIPPFGAVGSAVASAAALSFWNLAMAVYVRRRVGVDATAAGRRPLPYNRLSGL